MVSGDVAFAVAVAVPFAVRVVPDAGLVMVTVGCVAGTMAESGYALWSVPSQADLEALRIAGEKMQESIAAAGTSEDELLADFKKLRGVRSLSHRRAIPTNFKSFASPDASFATISTRSPTNRILNS